MSKARICRIFNSQKGKLSKKALSVICSAAIGLAGLSGILPAAAETGEGAVKQAEFADNTILFESDYNGVTDYSSYRSDYWVGWGKALAGNAFTQNINGNGYISYTQNNMHMGVIRLGHDYKTNTIGEYNYVKAIPGRTYVIEYDMKIYANAVAQGKNLLSAGWPLGEDGQNMEIGVAVADPLASVNDMRLVAYKNGTSNYQVFDKYMLKSNPDSKTWDGNKDGWVHKKIVYTVPTDIDVSTNNALQIFIGYGSRCEISFDNIKVTSAGKYTGEVLADEDYSDSSAGCDKKTSFFSKASNDITPVYDPSDTSNKVIQCIKSRSNYSHLYLGADYVIPGFDGTIGNWQESQNRVATQSITVELGQKYYIKFKYKLTKGAGTTEPNFFDLGIGTITHNTYGENGFTLDTWGNNKNYDNVSNFITKDTAAVTEGWQTYETFYTAESINKTSDGVAKDKLAIICKIANNYYNIYFDDVTVIKISSEKSVVDSDAVIYDTDFADAIIRSNRDLPDTFGDAYPVADPLDSSDKSVLYNGGNYNNGIIFIGSKMTDANEAKSSAISAKAGASYKVEFSYYVTGKLSNPTGNPLRIGLCVRSTTGNSGDNKYKYSFNKELEVVSQTEEFNMNGYKTVTANVEIPEGTDFSTYGNKLALYMRGQGVNVYIDNITVTELAPVSVKFVVNGESEYKVFGGNNISYSAAEGKSMVWYTDKAKTKSFGFDFYDNGGKIDSVTVYGEEVKSDIPLIKGDVNCDGAFSSEDLAYMRKVLLGAEAVNSGYHADVTSDGGLNIIDLVRIKKTMANTVPKAYTINGNAVSSYKIVYAENLGSDVAENKNVFEYVKSLAALTGINAAADSEAATEYEIIIGNANRVGVITDLAKNSYIVKAEGNKLYVNGGSVNALIAAIKTLTGHINTGKEINNTYFVDFEYSGGDFPTTLSLAFSEDFSTDFTGAIDNKNNEATASYRDNWTQTYHTDLSNTTTKAENGNLVLYGESYIAEDGSTAYRGGEVNTKNYYKYGYFEIRAKVNASNGICPAFWLCGSRDSASKIEYEIDVFECFGKTPDIIKGTLLAHNYPNGSTDGKESSEHNFIYNRLSGDLAPINNYTDNFNNTFFKGDWGNDFHTYGLDLKPDSITWYIDGKAVLTAKPSEVCGGKYIFNEPMRVRLTCYAGRDVNSPMTGLPDKTTDWKNGNSLIVDYVRIYQYN